MSQFGSAEGFILREGGVVTSSHVASANSTHKQFLLDNLGVQDNGREFQCTIAEFTSNKATITVLCMYDCVRGLGVASLTIRRSG